MVIAGLLIIVIPFAVIGNEILVIILLILSLIAVHVSAISNGLKMHGKINVPHHLVRLLISILIIVLYIF